MKNYELYVPIDLTLFDANVQTTLLNSTGNDLSPEMKTYYEDRLIDNAEPNLIFDQFGDQYNIPKNGGKTIEFRKYDPLPKAMSPLTEGVTPDGNSLNVTTVSSTVAQYGDYVTISDVLELTAIDRNIEQATKLLGAQAGRTGNTVTREVICGGTNVMYVPTISGGSEVEVLSRSALNKTSNLSVKAIFKAVAKLRSQNASPIDDAFVAVVHPNVACDLMLSTGWQEVHKYAQPDEIYKGEIGMLGGVRFVQSTEAKVYGPAPLFGKRSRFTLKTALDSTGSTTIAIKEAISATEAAELTAAIASGTVKIYVGGKEATLSAVTAGAAGSASFTASAAVKSVAADSMVCGYGCAASGDSVYATMVIGANAYGVTSVNGGGLQHIVKPLGSAGSADPLNQRATTGWKMLKTAERLVEQNMVRIEHCCETAPIIEAN